MTNFTNRLRSHEPVKPNDCISGAILWLPAQKDLPPSTRFINMHPACFGHPVLLSNWDAETDFCEIFIITSFHNTRNQLPGPGRRTQYGCTREHFLPLPPAPSHPDSNVRLEMEGSVDKMWAGSYVNTKLRCVVPRAWIGEFWKGKAQLTSVSMAYVRFWHESYCML